MLRKEWKNVGLFVLIACFLNVEGYRNITQITCFGQTLATKCMTNEFVRVRSAWFGIQKNDMSKCDNTKFAHEAGECGYDVTKHLNEICFGQKTCPVISTSYKLNKHSKITSGACNLHWKPYLRVEYECHIGKHMYYCPDGFDDIPHIQDTNTAGYLISYAYPKPMPKWRRCVWNIEINNHTVLDLDTLWCECSIFYNNEEKIGRCKNGSWHWRVGNMSEPLRLRVRNLDDCGDLKFILRYKRTRTGTHAGTLAADIKTINLGTALLIGSLAGVSLLVVCIGTIFACLCSKANARGHSSKCSSISARPRKSDIIISEPNAVYSETPWNAETAYDVATNEAESKSVQYSDPQK